MTIKIFFALAFSMLFIVAGEVARRHREELDNVEKLICMVVLLVCGTAILLVGANIILSL